MRDDARVADQTVDLAEALRGLMNHVAHVDLVAHVGGYSDDLRAAIADFLQRLLQTLHVGVGKRDLGARSRQRVRGVPSDALCRARYDNDFSLHGDFTSR